jgi:GMP synthase (glutamine-hydrolysing)
MVCKNEHAEIGWFPIERTPEAMAHPLGRIVPKSSVVLHWHRETFALPVGAIRLASSEACRNQAFAIGDHVLALQFHLETTPAGAAQLVEQCHSDLKPGPFVQPAERILGAAEDFQRINTLLVELLQAFA